MTDIEEIVGRLRRLEEVERARGFLHEYASVLDDPRPDAMAELFLPEAELRGGAAEARGREEIREFFVGAFAADPSAKRHLVMNPRATWLSPGRVRVEAYFLYVGRGDASVIGWGTYDAVVDTEGESPHFASLAIDVHLGTTLAAGWAVER